METRKITRCSFCHNDVAAVDANGWCKGCVLNEYASYKQKVVFKVVREIEPCTVSEVADEMRFSSTNSAYYHLKVLRDLGLVDWKPNTHRTIHEKRW